MSVASQLAHMLIAKKEASVHIIMNGFGCFIISLEERNNARGCSNTEAVFNQRCLHVDLLVILIAPGCRVVLVGEAHMQRAKNNNNYAYEWSRYIVSFEG